MPVEVIMPRLVDSVDEAVLGRWLKRVGDQVAAEEPLLELLSDKVTVEVVAPSSGVLQAVMAAEGEAVRVGQVLARIALAGEAPAEELAPAPPAAERPSDAVRPPEAAPAVPLRETHAVEVPRSATTSAITEGERLYSPRVRQLATEHGLTLDDLAALPGSGLGGRLTAADLERHLAARGAAPRPVATPRNGHKPDEHGDELVAITPMRRAIASHLTRSVAVAPHGWASVEVDMTAVERVRDEMRARFEADEGIRLTYLPFFAAAVVAALRAAPALNAAWEEGALCQHRHVHLGVAVALDDGLVVPVVRGAESLNLVGLARALHEQITRARRGQITPGELQGGTITINNTGAFGSVLSRPIINHPQVAIVTMEAMVRRVVVLPGDAIAIRPRMNLCLSFDERAVAAPMALAFLEALRGQLESWPPTAVAEAPPRGEPAAP